MRSPVTPFAVGLLLAVAMPAAAETLTVGYVELADDPRYDQGRMDARIHGQPWGRPFAGAEVAADEVRFPLSTTDVSLELRRETVDSGDALEAMLDRFAQEDVNLVMLDLPDELVPAAVRASDGNGQTLFNVSATGDTLRGQACHRRLFHLAPSEAIRMDGLAQYLVERGWRRILILQGPTESDMLRADAFRAAVDRYGLEIADTREFVQGHDPRQREANNLDLLTRGENFDAIFVADSDGEFARTVPYHTRAPRPVVGSAGLVPAWWHWNWRRHGAPQLNNRFQRHAGRPMADYDWSSWIGIKAIAEAVIRGGHTEAGAIAEFLRSDAVVLDGFQGYRLSFRPWNNQLRLPTFLTTPNWVVARAPFEGFLHPDNDLDSLGRAERESACEL